MYTRCSAAMLVVSLVCWSSTTAWTQTLEPIGRIPGPAASVHVHEDRAYVSAGPTVRIIDITDPTAPMLLGSIDFPQDVRGVRVSGTVAYAAIGFAGVGVFDVSDPTRPRSLGEVQTPGQALSIALTGSTVVVTNRLSGLEIIDISNPTAPVEQGSYFAEGYAIDVDAAGSYAYVVDTPGGLSLVDLTQSGETPAISNQQTTEQPVAVAVTTIQTAGLAERTIAGLMSADSLLELVDVTDPSAPVAVGRYRDDERDRPAGYIAAAAIGGLVRVRIQEATAFITDAYPPFQVEVVDVSDPADPARMAVYHPTGSPQDISVAGPLVFVAVASESPGVEILQLHR